MRYIPHKYQEVAAQWIEDKPRCALFLDCGLGKSVITLTAIHRLMDDCEVARTLVVAPKKVAETTWTDEASKWDHLSDLRVVRVMGSERQRKEALNEKADIYVIGRDSFVWLVGYYGGMLPFDALVIDELTSFKSSKSQRFKAMRMATPTVSRVIGLTGTPAPNGLIDMWAEMYCIDMGERLGKSITKYRAQYFDVRTWNNVIVKCNPKKGCDDLIRHRIEDICLSMQAKDYLTLPDMMTHDVSIDLPATVMKRYNDFERDMVLEFQDLHAGEPSNILANSAAGLMNKLSQFANGAVYDGDGNSHEVHTEKLDRLTDIVEAANAGDNGGVLVFYQYKHDIPRIVQRLKGRKVVLYDGPDTLKAWNSGEIDVLLAHPASTAYGLNMQQGGHCIVWFGTGWNLELYQQANARLHRQGQPYPVQVYKLLCRGTVDERACAALESKAGVQQGVMDGLNYLLRKYNASMKQTREVEAHG